MVLLQSVVQVYVGPMPNRFVEFAPDGRQVGIVTIGSGPISDSPGHRPGGTKERPSGEIPGLAQDNVHQCAIAVDGPVQNRN
jgi:hypothetical protein